mmetsp:Transcript_42564/g.134027  ORF Transcript_42564/g.134027 Transcript_42564/m.134027 type:complete len:516 (-) Transcript_42564:733-2280(-)
MASATDREILELLRKLRATSFWEFRAQYIAELGECCSAQKQSGAVVDPEVMQQVVAEIAQKAGDWSEHVRAESLSSLGIIGEVNEQVVAALCEGMKDQYENVRNSAVAAMTKAVPQPNEDVLRRLDSVLFSFYEDVRECALNYLVSTASPETTVEALAKLLGSDSQEQRLWAVASMGKLALHEDGGMKAQHPYARPVVVHALKLVQDEQWQVQRKALGIVSNVVQAGYSQMVEDLCDPQILQEYVDSPQEVVQMIVSMHKGAASDESSFVHQQNPFLERPFLHDESVLRVRLNRAEKLLSNTVSVYNALSPQVGGVHRKKFTFSIPRHKLNLSRMDVSMNSSREDRGRATSLSPQLLLGSPGSRQGSPKEVSPKDTTILNSLVQGRAVGDDSRARFEFQRDLERNRSFYQGYKKPSLKRVNRSKSSLDGSSHKSPTYSQVFNLADLDLFEKDIFMEKRYQPPSKFTMGRAPSPVVRMEVVRGHALSTTKVVRDHLSQMCNDQLRQLREIKLHDIL